jgi:hypothetical protein
MQSFAILERNLGLEVFLVMIELSFVTGLWRVRRSIEYELEFGFSKRPHSISFASELERALCL